MDFVDVILPLPLHGKFTYAIPEELQGALEVGMRIYVPFGRRKYYTAIVDEIHHRRPENYEVKEVLAKLEERPSVRYPQRKLWEWLADYYLCTVGDVYKAALPSGMKIESETYVSLNKDFENDGGIILKEREAEIVIYLENKQRVRLDEMGRDLKDKNIGTRVNMLLSEGIIRVDEKAVERYRSKKEKCIRLSVKRGDQDALHSKFDLLTRSARQQNTLIAYLDKSGWFNLSHHLREVTKAELLTANGTNPGIIKALVDKGVFEEYTRVTNRFEQTGKSDTIALKPLSEAQSSALKKVRSEMQTHAVTLLHGVTGSGKTEIYTHLMKDALDSGKQILYLVPEISLTTQLTDRLRRVFGDRMLVYHSKFGDSERVDIYKRVLESHEPLIVLGVRSAVFLPFFHLGLVIVDEEHESSYKQYDPAPRYNGRDAAIVLASMHGAKTLLGSGTPAVETYYKAENGKYGLVELAERFEGAVLPDVEIVDMKVQRKRKVAKGILSEPLRESMHAALKEGAQGIMFQNRRGFAPYVVCTECGWKPKCVNCDVSLVYHKQSNQLRCHYCGYSITPPNVCPACGQNGIEVFGYGTERIAEELHKEFDGYRVARMDLDTTRNKDSYQEIIEEFSRHETDILVGTQMVTKGLDFDKVRVVGVLNADTMLNFPDFRSNERAFNMIEQVSGRAGRRRDQPGKVIVQTTDPDNDVLARVKAHDYDGFYRAELSDREKYLYPPYTRIIVIYIKNKDARLVDSVAVGFALALRRVFGQRVLGPEKPFVSRVSTWYLQSIMLKVESEASMKKVKEILRAIYEQMCADPCMKGTLVYYDVDPV